jgi:hypothetical protein
VHGLDQPAGRGVRGRGREAGCVHKPGNGGGGRGVVLVMEAWGGGLGQGRGGGNGWGRTRAGRAVTTSAIAAPRWHATGGARPSPRARASGSCRAAAAAGQQRRRHAHARAARRRPPPRPARERRQARRPRGAMILPHGRRAGRWAPPKAVGGPVLCPGHAAGCALPRHDGSGSSRRGGAPPQTRGGPRRARSKCAILPYSHPRRRWGFRLLFPPRRRPRVAGSPALDA